MTIQMKASLAAGALLLSSGAALAASATATTALNVRSGPGATYAVIDTLPAGESVNLLGCTGAWCEISMGPDGAGFVNESYLDRHGRAGGRVVVEEPSPVVGLAIGGYWDSQPYYIRDGYYFWGGRWYGDRPGRPGWRDRSWRRWEERREARLDDRRDRIDDRRDRMDDRRDASRDRREGPRDDRRERIGERRDDRRDAAPNALENRREPRMENRQDRMEDRQQRVEAQPERTAPAMSARPQSRDSGDRFGLDRSGGGGSRGDAGGRGEGGGSRGGEGRGGGESRGR